MRKLASFISLIPGGTCSLVLTVLSFTSSAHAQQPTSHVGSIFAYPNGQSWSNFGAYVGPPTSTDFFKMTPESLKVIHTRFHVLKESDDTKWSWFPYSALRVFEGQEMAAGRPPIFVTANYQGKTRQIVWNWSLGLQGSKPTRPPSEWEYAVNVGDDRFINFWINNYIRSVILPGYQNLQNSSIGLDECAFIPALYGVIDDNGNFVSGVQWDQPFPQNADAYYQSIERFFTQVHQKAPDLKLIPNSGGIGDWSQFANVFGASQGLMIEELNPSASVPSGGMYTRNQLQSQLAAYSAEAAQGYPMILASIMDSSDQSRIATSFLLYMLIEGANTYYAPAITGSPETLPPAAYQNVGAGLGNPTGSLQSQQLPGSASSNPGLRTYWREFQNGIVYLNWTGSTQTIPLPAGHTYYTGGKAVTSITLPDLAATWLTYQ